jgi:hypothetical protein
VRNWRLDQLSTREVSLLIATLGHSEVQGLWVCHRGWKSWRPLTEVIDNFPRRLNTEHRRTPLPPEHVRTSTVDPTDEESTQVHARIETPDPIIRKFPRYGIEIPVTILSGANQFKTFTLDVSLGGICLRETIPDWVAGYCSMILHIEGVQDIELLCTVVEDQRIGQKTRMELVPSTQLDRLKEWLDVASRNLKPLP